MIKIRVLAARNNHRNQRGKVAQPLAISVKLVLIVEKRVLSSFVRLGKLTKQKF